MKVDNVKTFFVAIVVLGMVIGFSGCLQQEVSTQEKEPCEVRNLNASDKVSGVATLTWDVKCPVLNNTNGTSIAYYKVYRDGEHVRDSEDNQYIDYGVEVDEEYTYRVSAVSTEGVEGPKSDPASVKIKPGMPGV
ncbi:hypothetical protein C9439_03065 [archaeon SCG-AAA382B04]|nr:hypothetical protein C9439_03065 [archaeon SCG-AAA382B04]